MWGLQLSGEQNSIHSPSSFEDTFVDVFLCADGSTSEISSGVIRTGDTEKTRGIESHSNIAQEKTAIVSLRDASGGENTASEGY